LKNPRAEYTHIYSTIMALRFHGDENTGVIPREKLLGAMRLLLKNQDFADQVILDLSRWEDWSVLDQMVEMFKNSDAKGYVRQPVVSYLTVASEQEGAVGARAKAAIAELEKLDPDTVKTARSLMAFGALGRARGAASSNTADAKTAAAATEPSTASSDSPQAFSASPDDEKTDVSQIPDPTSFGQTAPAGKNGDGGSAKAPTAAKPGGKVPVGAGQPSADVSLPPATFHPLLVAGLPLGAAAVLMGIYWAILRAGTV
jgi:hypothetical protein